MADFTEPSQQQLLSQSARPKPPTKQQSQPPATADAMSLDPHRASVVVDLLESATRAGALEKQEAAAILSSWIEEQKQVRSGNSSPGPDSEPSHTPPPPPLPTVPTPPSPLLPQSAGTTAAPTMTIKTTTMTTTTSPLPTPPPALPAQQPASASVAVTSGVVTFKEAASSLTPKSMRRLSRQLPTTRYCSVPSTPTAASAGRQFSFSTPVATLATPATSSSAGKKAPPQHQKRRRSQHHQQQQQPIRSLLHVFTACAIGERGSEEGSEESDSPAPPEPAQHRFYLDPLPPPPTQPQQPPLPPRPASSTGSDPQAYALYDPAGAEQNTYCYIDESDLMAEAAEGSNNKSATKQSGASPSDTNDSGVYGSGLRFESADQAEAVYT